MAGPLSGVRVVDLTTVAMGPLATQMLGDMGADVIKVEKPTGDQFRHAPPARSPAMGGESFIPAQGATGYDRVLSRYRKPYRTRDGYIALLPYTTEHWERFFQAAEEPAYIEDPRFRTASARLNNVDYIYRVLEELVVLRTTNEWLELLADADIPVAPVLSIDDLLSDPHL